MILGWGKAVVCLFELEELLQQTQEIYIGHYRGAVWTAHIEEDLHFQAQRMGCQRDVLGNEHPQLI